MSVLIYKGDTTSNFGKYLPSPYIEKITLRDPTTGNAGLRDIVTSIFITVAEGEDVNKVVERIQDQLNFYFVFDIATARDQTEVIDGQKNIFKHYMEAKEAYGGRVSNPQPEIWGDEGIGVVQYEMKFFNMGETANAPRELAPVDIFYNEQGNQVYKFSTTYTLPLPGTGTPDIYIFAFSSTYEYSQDTIGNELDNLTLLNLKMSDVSYEYLPFLYTGQIQSEFFDENEEIYNEIPLQSLSGDYHKLDNVTHDSIVEYFEELVGQHKVAAETNLRLQQMLNNISHILNVSGTKFDLLVQLNNLRKVFPSKSSASAVGKLYARYKKRIFTMNKAIRRGTTLRKQLVRNFKIFDERTTPAETYVGTTDSFQSSPVGQPQHYLYNASYMGRGAIYSVVAEGEGEEGLYYSGGGMIDIIVRNSGFFFFDYEKALRWTADVNQIIDVRKIFINYGFEFPYDYFRVTKVELSRAEEEFEGIGNVGTVKIYSHMDSSKNYPLTLTTETDNEYRESLYSIPSPGYDSTYPDDTGLSAAEHNFLMYRNFEPMQTNSFSEQIPNYHLMCFQFQDFYDDDVAQYSATAEYNAKVTIEDQTPKIIKVLISSYETTKQNLWSYYDKAQDPFSYESSTGIFNDFFSEGMVALYEGTETEAPWYRAPVIYCIHRDLVYDTYGGDMDRILAEAKIITDQINPHNGSFYSLENFYNEMQAFYDTNYVESGSTINVAKKYNGMLDGDDVPIVEKTFENTVSYDSAGNPNTDTIYGMVEDYVEELLGLDEDCTYDWQCMGSDSFCDFAGGTTGKCNNYTETPDPYPDGEGEFDDYCAEDIDCKSNNCIHGGTGYIDPQTGEDIHKCGGGTGAENDPCTRDEECGGNILKCNSGYCSKTGGTSSPGGDAFGDAGVTLLGNGADCHMHADCKSGVCSSVGKCEQGTTTIGNPCFYTEQCDGTMICSTDDTGFAGKCRNPGAYS
jgi:hypothetical protein